MPAELDAADLEVTLALQDRGNASRLRLERHPLGAVERLPGIGADQQTLAFRLPFPYAGGPAANQDDGERCDRTRCHARELRVALDESRARVRANREDVVLREQVYRLWCWLGGSGAIGVADPAPLAFDLDLGQVVGESVEERARDRRRACEPARELLLGRGSVRAKEFPQHENAPSPGP